MNETDLGGRTIRVSEARPMTDRRDGGGNRGGAGGGNFQRRNFDGNNGPVQKRSW